MNTADSRILEWAAREGRQVFTRDRNTMTAEGWDRVRRGMPMPGVFVVPEEMTIGRATRELEILGMASDPADWEGQVVFLPL